MTSITEIFPARTGIACLIMLITDERDLLMGTFHCNEPMGVQRNTLGNKDMYDTMYSVLENAMLDKTEHYHLDLETKGILHPVV